jgi:hypothetical protein
MLAAIENRSRNPIDDADLYMMASSAAYELEHLYTGFEKISERHFTFTGTRPVGSSRYHKELLLKAFENKLVTTKVSQRYLTDLLGFRHFVRMAYGVDLHIAVTFRKVRTTLKRWPLIAKKLRRAVGLKK